MRIGDVAQRSGLATSRIRFYERHGLIPRAVRGANGYRNYSMDVVETLNFIRQAQGLGFTLDEIRGALTERSGGLPAGKDVLPALREKLATLDRHIDEVMLRKQRIIALIEKYENRP